MIRLTRSLEIFLFQYYKDLLVPLSFGHSEVLTDEIWQEYLNWCQTDEAKPYMEFTYGEDIGFDEAYRDYHHDYEEDYDEYDEDWQ